MITNAPATTAPEAFDALIDDSRRLSPPDRSSPSFTGRRVTDTRSAGREEPPYLVRFDDGHTALMFPGPDSIIEHRRGEGSAKGR